MGQTYLEVKINYVHSQEQDCSSAGDDKKAIVARPIYVQPSITSVSPVRGSKSGTLGRGGEECNITRFDSVVGCWDNEGYGVNCERCKLSEQQK